MPQISPRVWIRRAYEDPSPNDGHRVLVDRLWPRGISKQDLSIDEWTREVSPSDDLRHWFDHDPDRWEEFQRRYRAELAEHDDLVEALVSRARQGRVTLVYGAKDTEHNNAVALGQLIEERR